MSLLAHILRLHQSLTAHALPKGCVAGSKEHEAAKQFAYLFLLALIFIPFFAAEFVVTGYVSAAVVLAAAGGIMLSSFWVFKYTGSLALGRDIFLGSLFFFLIWEAQFFGTVYSPGSLWLVVMPVVSVLLGSIRAGVAWLIAALAVLALTFFLAGDIGPSEPPVGQYATLYTVSVGGAILSIFLFVLMVDRARVEALLKLAVANRMNEALAERDELTGLLNRRAMQLHLTSALDEVKPGTVFILFADLDGFKDINDTHGHDAGDKVIQEISRRLAQVAEQHGAVLARLGGDEFAFLITRDDASGAARRLASAALDLICGSVEVDGNGMLLGVSLGGAGADATVSATELLRRADVAMYEAKQQGGNRLCCYEPELDRARYRHQTLAATLAEALSAEEFFVHYQPIVDSGTLEVAGVEALARWTTGTGERVPPDVFIPVAEKSGLINKLGLYVLERACRDASSWQEVKLSVNLSPIQFRSPSLVGDVLRVLERTGFPAERLELEVTEGYLIEHRERAQPIIEALRSAGIRIALDDFGSGYSSIGYLRQYEFDRLKLDKSLIRGMATDAASQSIVQAAAILARSLSLNLTAEGVETREEATLLRLAGCSSLQGFFFGHPMDAVEITPLLKQQPGARSISPVPARPASGTRA